MWQVGVASGASTSSYIDLGGKSYTKLAINYVTMSTGTVVNIFGSPTASGTYLQVNSLIATTATVAYQPYQIATSVSGSGWAVVDAPPFRYIQLVCTGVVSGGVSFTVQAFD
jgi:hypothetical protein